MAGGKSRLSEAAHHSPPQRCSFARSHSWISCVSRGEAALRSEARIVAMHRSASVWATKLPGRSSSPNRNRPVHPPRPAPAPETWTPEGTLVSQRNRALEGATVLVCTAIPDRGTTRYAAASLGCTYRANRTASGNVMTEPDAAQAANTHATDCRAVPRGIPTRPTAADVDGPELAAILRELIEDTDPPGGLIPPVAQLLTVAARRAEQIEPDRDREASCPLHEAAPLLTDNAGQRLVRAARSLDPQGEPV
ncbi:hypothetical protein [Streptomyces sviceus]|uniref:hypothetical protein n=1 Tax=Streptomyces sviceus TaxID=285530 RepID=UPI0033227DB6